MKRLFMFSSIQTRIATMFSFLIIITILTFIALSYRTSFIALWNNSQSYTHQLVNRVNADVDIYIRYMQDISKIIVLNKDVENYLRPGNIDDDSSINIKSKAQEFLHSIILARTDITNVAVFDNNGDRYIFNEADIALNKYNPPSLQPWFKAAIDAKGEPVISSSHVQNTIDNKYCYVVSLSMAFKEHVTGDILGVALVDLNYDKITDLCSNISLGKCGYIFIIDDTGDIVYHPQQQLIYSNLKYENIDLILQSDTNTCEYDDKLYTIAKSKYTNWQVVGVTYIDELIANSTEIQAYYLIAAIIFIIFSLIVSYYLAHRISKPIMDFSVSMKEIEKGHFDNKVEINSNDEIGTLAHNYNIMTDKIKELIEQNQRDYELKRKNELKVLQAQINPHFLYNTLDSIIWMAEDEKTNEVVLMTNALAKLFRISINRGTEFITIATEIIYIKSYLIIQEIRYKDKISYEFSISDDILDGYILKILLQPLVENAIYHGLKNTEAGGKITIEGYREENLIYFKIIDTGIGMTKKQLSNIFNPKKSENSKQGNGVGVNNVNERIKLYYGDNYGLSFESEFLKGTTATVIIPFINKEV